MVRLLITKTLRDLRRQRGQFLAVIVTIFLGVTMFAASYGAYQNLEASYFQMFDDLHFADFTVSGGQIDQLVDDADAVAGVQRIDTRTVIDTPVQVENSRLLGRLVTLPQGSQPSVNQVDVLSGDYFSEGDANAALIEQHMAAHFDLEAGDSVEVYAGGEWRTLMVSGVVATPEYLWPAPSRQEIFPGPGQFGVIFVPDSFVDGIDASGGTRQALFYFEPAVDRAALHQQLSELARDSGAAEMFTREEQPSNAVLSLDIQAFNQLSYLFPILFLTAAGLAAYVLLTRIVLAQRSQIGMMLANGYSHITVFLHYLAYGLLVGIVGAVPGTAAGTVLAQLVTSVYTAELSIPIVVTEFHAGTVAIGIAFGLVVGVLATLVPALSAFRMSPAEAMRGVMPAGTGHQSFLERVFPPLKRLPSRWKLVLRGIGRNRQRSLSTVIGVILSLALVLVSWGMLDTVDVLLDRQFNQIQRQDATVYLTQPTDEGQMERLSEVDGVAATDPMAEISVSLRSDPGQYGTTLIGLPAGTAMHEFRTADGEDLQLPENGILAGQALREQLDVSAGDTLTLAVPALGLSVDETIAGFVNEPLGTYAYTSLPHLRDLMSTGSAGENTVEQQGAVRWGAMVQYQSGVDRDAVASRIEALPAVGTVQDSRVLVDTIESFMGLFYAFIGVMLVFGGLIAFTLIFNMMSVNIAERSVEIAALRAFGVSHWGMARLILAENMLLTMLGIVPGLLVGYAVAWWFMGSYSSDMFQFDLQMRWSTLVLSALAMILVALLSEWPGLRSVGRLDLGRVVRERSV